MSEIDVVGEGSIAGRVVVAWLGLHLRGDTGCQKQCLEWMRVPC
jgi:hypothetical protein